MHHEPRGSCALTLQNGSRMGESDNCPSCRLLFRLSLRKLRNMLKVRKTIRWRVTILLLSFFGFKIPRPSAESFLLRI